MHKPLFVDLEKFDEDQRIIFIANSMLASGRQISFLVETKPKARRYIKKLHALHPGKFTFRILKGPAAGMFSVIVNLSKPINN